MLYFLLDRSGVRDWLHDHGVYWMFSLLDQLAFRAGLAGLLAFFLVVLLGPRTIRFLLRMKIGDAGLSDAEALRKHSASKANTPTMGGVLIAGAITVSTLLLADVSSFYVALGLIVLAWLAVLGGFDDWLKLTAARRGAGSRQGLYAWEKLVFQLGIGLLVGWFAYSRGDDPAQARDVAHVLNLPFQKTYDSPTSGVSASVIVLSPVLFVAISTLVVAGMSNAVNITDGMDGLAAGISGIVSIGLLVLVSIAGSNKESLFLLVPFIDGSGELAVLAGAMAGACFGFLWWNCSPAAVFMGDTGALCLGGLIGYIAVVVRQEAVVLLMSAVCLAELGSVAIQVGYFKATRGKRVFRCAPYHHHLHLGGWTETQVVIRFWIVTAILAAVALASLKVR